MAFEDGSKTFNIKWKRQLLMKEYSNKSREEIEQILSDLTFRKNFIEKSQKWIYRLNSGKDVVWGRGEPSAFFNYSAEQRYEELNTPIVWMSDLNSARYVLKEVYFKPYLKWYEKNLEGDINLIHAIDLYPMVYKFIQDNDIPRSEDWQCVIQFPLRVGPNFVFFHVSQNLKKAFICSDGFDVIRLNAEKLETYQDFLDDKWL